MLGDELIDVNRAGENVRGLMGGCHPSPRGGLSPCHGRFDRLAVLDVFPEISRRLKD